MRGLSVPLLLFVSAIAVVCVVVLWRHRTRANTPRRESREQAQPTDSSARISAVSVRARPNGSIPNASKCHVRPQTRPRAGASLHCPAAPTALAPPTANAAAERQSDDPWLGRISGERMEPADSAAALPEELPSLPVADERLNADESAVTALPVESSHNADCGDGRIELTASLAPAVPPLADGSPAIGVVDLPGPDIHVIAAGSAALTAPPIEAALQNVEPDTPLADGSEQQFAPPAPVLDRAAADHVANVPFAAERETSATSQPPPEANLEQEPAAATAGHDVEHAVPIMHVHEPAATAATAAETFFEAAVTPQPASAEAAPPAFVPSIAPAGLSPRPPRPAQSEAAAKAERELGASALGDLPVARADALEPTVAAQVEAAAQVRPPEPEAVVLPEQLAVVQADEATALDRQGERTTGRADDFPPSEDDTAQLQHSAQDADETTGGEPSAELELDDPDALLRNTLSRPAHQAVHRDRRGRQPSLPQPGAERKRAKQQSNALRTPAEARLRLILHPIRRTVGLALILLRPTEFPERVTLELNGLQPVDALGEGQYGDVDLIWGADLLVNEIRVSCTEDYQWVRSARSVHIFAADPVQADLISVSAATADTEHTIICRDQDAGTVCDIAESAGSARPQALRRFSGVPDGWVVLSGYRPTRAASLQPAQAFSTLDPGHGLEIKLQGGLEVGRRLYAQGKPPRIRIEPALDGIAVRIGGVVAAASSDGAWEAPGWDTPGQHRVEIVPGPSMTYEVQVDPAMQGGWAFWDAHGSRTADNDGPWSQAQICGAKLSGPSGERVMAAELQPSILALGIDGTVAVLRPRTECGVSVGFAAGMPAFLLISWGRRRCQGKIVWLGLPQLSEVVEQPRRLSRTWIETIRSVAARRLTMQADEGGLGQSIWRKAVLLARSAKRQRDG